VLREKFGTKREGVKVYWRKLHNKDQVARGIRREHADNCGEET
jgi:hypothetical protein